jgi:hypothetical protein
MIFVVVFLAGAIIGAGLALHLRGVSELRRRVERMDPPKFPKDEP